MSLLDRFFGRPDPSDPSLPVANPNPEKTISQVILFFEPVELDEESLTFFLQNFHPELQAVRVELLTVPPEANSDFEGVSQLGLISWGDHIAKLIGLPSPIPQELWEVCVPPAHYVQELKDHSRFHRGHILLDYGGYHPDLLEHAISLTVLSSALAAMGGILLLNEAGRTSIPAEVLLADDPDVDRMEGLRNLPIPLFYSGFVKFEVEDEPGIWMRTFGNDQFRLPDLAMKLEGHDQGEATFQWFSSLLSYLRESKRQFIPGDTVTGEDTQAYRIRAPQGDELRYLSSEGEMLVLEKT